MPEPAFEAYSNWPTPTIQQVAAWPVATLVTGVRIPSAPIVNEATALVPASAICRRPAWSKLTPNGTVPGSELTTGVAEGPPKWSTPKTSTELVLRLRRHHQLRTAGVNAI